MLRDREGRWFDPEITKAARSMESDHSLWQSHAEHRRGEEIEIEHPGDPLVPSAGDVDEICGAFADIVDAKSSFTAEHSSRVTNYAVKVARHMGLNDQRVTTLRRSALLHDIGKLGVSNAILDKPGKLKAEEFNRIKEHPRYSFEILKAIRGFGRIAEIAASHHERLDGKGYWRGLPAESIDIDMRILAVADVFDALTAERPYRPAMTTDDALKLMWKQGGSDLDSNCLTAIREVADRENLPISSVPQTRPIAA
jgi:putative nucleotidyltransferase with HDIG domain